MERACRVYAIHLSPHPSRMDLEVGDLGPYQVVVGRHYDDGQLGFFIPEGSVIPDKLAAEMRVKGRLAGKKRNRVKPRDWDGVKSDGLFYGTSYHDGEGPTVPSPSWNSAWEEGDDVASEVGVSWREKPLP